MEKYFLKLDSLIHIETLRFKRIFEKIPTKDDMMLYHKGKKCYVRQILCEVELENGLTINFSVESHSFNIHYFHENLEEGVIYDFQMIEKFDPFFEYQSKLGLIKVKSRSIETIM